MNLHWTILIIIFVGDKFIDIIPPELGGEIPRPELKPGETDLGTSSLNFEEFSKIHFKSNE